MAKPRGFDLDAVALLEAIAEAGSLAKAAARLGKVPSALTWQVRRLEESLDLLLVDRRGGRARLTEAARQLLRDGLGVRQALDDALARARRAALGYEAELVIAVDAIVPVDVLWPLVRAFDALGAPTQLRLWHEVLSGSWEALLSGRADLVVGAPGDAPAHREVRTAALGTVDFVYCVAPGHPLAREPEPLTPDQIVRHRAVAVADSARGLPRRTTGLLPGQPVLTVPTFEFKLSAQAEGLGCGYLPRHCAQAAIAEGRLLARATVAGRVQASINLAWRDPVRGKALAWWVDALSGPRFTAALQQAITVTRAGRD
jgi:molybdate transport repressor ModE-like protein